MTARLRLPVLLAVAAIVAIGCQQQLPPKPAFTGDLEKGNPTTSTTVPPAQETDAPPATPLGPAQSAQLAQDLASIPVGCEILSTKACLLPFPSDAYTVSDPTTATTRRVNLPPGLFPNTSGTTLDVTQWNRNDGFSPNTPIIVFVPNLDAAATKLPSETDIGASVEADSATVIIDLDTGQLVPHWAELDSRATSPDNQALILHPATSLIETHRFAVALRNMIGTDGAPLQPSVAFQALRDNNITGEPRVDDRHTDFNTMFAAMSDAGVNREGLYLAWPFTVASPNSLAGRLLFMRNDAFGQLNGDGPQFTVTSTNTTGLQPGMAKTIAGTFQVPLYLSDGGVPGSHMTYDATDGDPVSSGDYTAKFQCDIPTKVQNSGEGTPVVYGHGLLGTADEVTSSDVQTTAVKNNSVYCATDWIGLAEEDTAYAVKALGDLSLFPSIPDRQQQGILNTLYLGRLLKSDKGFGSNRAFQTRGGANMLNNNSIYFDGNSQGAISGGAATAVSQDWTKAVLGVAGMNYSTLLNRSVDFDKYFAVMRAAYPDPLDQQQLFGVLQMLWDRGDTAGYVQHLTDRAYDSTPAHEVILTEAYGDHQVANVTANNIARTLKLPIHAPIVPKGVVTVADPFWNLTPIAKYPLDGSAIYYFYSGTLPAPIGNITPIMGAQYQAQCSADPTQVPCLDPHGDVRRQPAVMALKKAFFHPNGAIINVCKDRACLSKPKAQFPF